MLKTVLTTGSRGMGAGSLVFGFLAGVFSTLSPCVLPLLPLVLSGALAAHRHGMAALTAGLVTSFVVVGLFVATIGFSIGLDGDVFRTISAVMLAVFGVVLLSGVLQTRFAVATSGIGNIGNRLIARLAPGSLRTQFLIGAILGVVWSPCVGPTLGSASMLATQGKSLGIVAAVMAAFGLGAALPLVLVGHLSRTGFKRWRGSLMEAGQTGKYALGFSAITISLLILTGFDHRIETQLLTLSPDWLTNLTTGF